MSSNIGMADRGLRLAVGLILIVATLTGAIGAWGWIGLVPLVTGAIGRCPMYKLFGLSTCPLHSKS